MPHAPLRLLILGAHPDDCEYHAGGLAAIYREAGHAVKMVSVTNGESGHFEISGEKLAAIRRDEARVAAAVIDAESAVWEHPDGRLLPMIELREQVIREIRRYRPDLVLTHRPNDYHPDHRAVGQAVQDASYLVTVPPICPDVPHLRHDPVVGYLPDLFTKPTRLAGDVVIDVTDRLDAIVRMLAAHRSQFFEWLPYHAGRQDEVPIDDSAQRAWLRDWYLEKIRRFAQIYRKELIATYGSDRGAAIEYCEVFEISEYAAPLDAAARQRLFWFVPSG
ncbi:MAG: PIG-L family deacetylase [Planctomycetaceae bacterium]|nr:PIG-L family deacetylase [Planctomycetaceae bacterium]